jgi:hypothetical protein
VSSSHPPSRASLTNLTLESIFEISANRCVKGFHSIENKKIPTKMNKNKPRSDLEMQNNERERLDLHTLVDGTSETFR